MIRSLRLLRLGGTFRFMPRSTAVRVPTADVAEQAKSAARELSRFTTKRAPKTLSFHAEGGGREADISVPKEAVELLVEILAQMANGNETATP